MEKVQEVIETMEVIESDIELYFSEYCTKYNIEDMSKEKQTRFNGAMTYIYRHYFKGTNRLKASPNHTVPNSINNMSTNYNAYDIDKLYELYLYLKEFANGYDKVASIAAFKSLTGISRQTITVWRNKPSNSSLGNDQKMFINWLTDNEEDELKEFNMRNPLGAQERLNVDHGRWEKRIITKDTSENQVLTAGDLPKLGANQPDELPQNCIDIGDNSADHDT